MFPQLHRQGGIERTCWDVLDYLGPRYETAFVGTSAPEGTPPGVRLVPVDGPVQPGPFGMLSRRSRTGKVLAALDPAGHDDLGFGGPPGDVLWVPSVHRAWLEAARTVHVGPVRVPARVRFRHAPAPRRCWPWSRGTSVGPIARHVLCTSDQVIEDLGRLYDVDPALCTVVPNMIDPERFNPDGRAQNRPQVRRQLGIGEDEVALMLIANELHRKGLAQLLEALALTGDPRLTLHVVGKAGLGPFRPAIERLGLDGRVHYHGPSDDVEPAAGRGRPVGAPDPVRAVRHGRSSRRWPPEYRCSPRGLAGASVAVRQRPHRSDPRGPL